ncbi:conserved hypothetical protein [Candidatus Accumulibacter aalborgensis]|uniref:Uncharacterized protein n=2 Tax=Candidatus Accumulibacter aalborgensis TaxID=1860102 RepID=A0A1A8XM57_9PROT|nr:conserved hypothetical protein [Candidatus Accumulibacter aalborgensis]
MSGSADWSDGTKSPGNGSHDLAPGQGLTLDQAIDGKAMNLQLLASLGWHELPILIIAALLGLVFFLVIRQNRKDYLDLVGILASEKTEFPS